MSFPEFVEALARYAEGVGEEGTLAEKFARVIDSVYMAFLEIKADD
jgi:hypothetical protein